jgi:hypothetical protein
MRYTPGAVCALAVLAWAACAGEPDAPDGAVSATTSASASSTSAGGSSDGGAGGAGAGEDGGAGGAGICGDGHLDPGEACDGDDFGDTTCASLGLGPGMLVCTTSCGIVVSDCGAPLEACNNGLDDDEDGAPDCDDADCASEAACLDGCAAPIDLAAPGQYTGSTAGRPSVHAAPCTPESGREVIYRIVPPYDGLLDLYLMTPGFSVSVSVTTACGDASTSVACMSSGGTSAVATHPVLAGQVYFAMVEGTSPAESGGYMLSYSLHAAEAPPNCTDSIDEDMDGHTDCADPGCQGTAQCASGPKATGEPCGAHVECASPNGDPHCLPAPANQGPYPDGYCSQFCDLEAPDCEGDSVCVRFGLSAEGICLDGCTSTADCRAGYECVGGPPGVCFLPPETSCDDLDDQDADYLVDCQDPDCATSPSCAPGAAPVGSECAKAADCQANDGDPRCLPSQQGWPYGYCSEWCDFSNDDCGPDAVCINVTGLAVPQNGIGSCLRKCASAADCRPQYVCAQMPGSSEAVCRFP